MPKPRDKIIRAASLYSPAQLAGIERSACSTRKLPLDRQHLYRRNLLCWHSIGVPLHRPSNPGRYRIILGVTGLSKPSLDRPAYNAHPIPGLGIGRIPCPRSVPYSLLPIVRIRRLDFRDPQPLRESAALVWNHLRGSARSICHGVEDILAA